MIPDSDLEFASILYSSSSFLEYTLTHTTIDVFDVFISFAAFVLWNRSDSCRPSSTVSCLWPLLWG